MTHTIGYTQMTEYFIYYKLDDGNFRIISSKTKQITTVDIKEWSSISVMYPLGNNTEPNDKNLKSYIKHYEQWIKELKTNDIYKFDHTE